MHAFLNVAFQAAREAGVLMVNALDRLDTVTVNEKSQHNFVSDIDKQAEYIIVKALQKAYPSHSILAEEGGAIVDNKGEYTWIIDPLDGTTNFLHGMPHFCISIALKHQDRIEHALVYDPLRQEVFSASRGAGCFYNDRKRLRVNNHANLLGAFVCVGSPRNRGVEDDTSQAAIACYIDALQQLYPHIAGIRRTGAAALDLAYVAAGRFDVFWETALKPWDIAAGSLLVTEAGGLVGDFEGGHHYLKSGDIIAANVKLFKAILPIIHRTHISGISQD